MPVQIQENKDGGFRLMLDVEFSLDGLREFYDAWGTVTSWDGEDEWYGIRQFLISNGVNVS